METFLKGCAQPRAKEFFGFAWQFALTDSLDTPDHSASWRAVQLPHDWSVDYPVEEDAPSRGSGGYARTGTGWYRRSFPVERAAQDRTALYFDGVYLNCDVWLNCSSVGCHLWKGWVACFPVLSPAVHHRKHLPFLPLPVPVWKSRIRMSSGCCLHRR